MLLERDFDLEPELLLLRLRLGLELEEELDDLCLLIERFFEWRLGGDDEEDEL